MLNVRLRCLRDTMMKLLINVAKYKGKPREEAMYLVQCLDFITYEFKNQGVNEEDLIFFEKELAQYQDNFSEISMGLSFGSLTDFVNKNINDKKNDKETN